jgi:hypothetical protein
MSEISLRDCENEVERARTKLAHDLAVLRSPSTMSAFTDDLKREALDAKDAMVDKAKSTAERLAEDLKAKAAANPAATLVIGAGLAWRLFRSPPIATVLVGAGIYSLWRTQTQPAAPGAHPDYFRQGKERLIEQASELAETTRQKAVEAGAIVSEKAAELASATSERLEQWGASAGATLDDMRSGAQKKTAEVADDAGRRLRGVADQVASVGADALGSARRAIDPSNSGPNSADLKDIVLRGVANVALAAAVGVIFKKRMGERVDS